MDWFIWTLLLFAAVGTAISLIGAVVATLSALNSFIQISRTIESDQEDEEDPDEDYEGYDYEEDEDYEEALATAERLEALLEGSDWSNARLLVNEIMDEKLPELLEIQNEIGLDLDDTEARIGGLGDSKRYTARREALEETLARQQALYDEVCARVDATKSALEQLLVIARERQVNGAPDATERATRLLTETQRENDLLLQTRREVEAVGRI